MAHDNQPRPNWMAFGLSTIAGLGHLIIGRPRRGLFLFVGASACWNLALVSWLTPVDPLGSWSLRFGIGVGGALSVFAFIDVFRLGVYARLPHVVPHAEYRPLIL